MCRKKFIIDYWNFFVGDTRYSRGRLNLLMKIDVFGFHNTYFCVNHFNSTINPHQREDIHNKSHFRQHACDIDTKIIVCIDDNNEYVGGKGFSLGAFNKLI